MSEIDMAERTAPKLDAPLNGEVREESKDKDGHVHVWITTYKDGWIDSVRTYRKDLMIRVWGEDRANG